MDQVNDLSFLFVFAHLLLLLCLLRLFYVWHLLLARVGAEMVAVLVQCFTCVPPVGIEGCSPVKVRLNPLPVPCLA